MAPQFEKHLTLDTAFCSIRHAKPHRSSFTIMEVCMNKQVIKGAVVVFVVLSVLDYVVHQVLLTGAYEATAHLWRPMAEMKWYIFSIVTAFVAFFFTLIFSKGYEGKGVGEGVRYGFYVGMMMAVPMAYGTYGSMPIPYSLALQWFIYGLIEYVLAGVVVSLVVGKKAAAA